jgi:hypothetical protein
MQKRGRPRGLTINTEAVEDLLDARCMSKSELCRLAEVTPGHFADMLHRRTKGASPALVRRMAAILDCKPETIAPELTNRFMGVRPGDDEAA